MLKILKYTLYDMLRSRWSISYFLFFLAAGFVLLHLSSDLTKAISSLMNITLILTPLIGTLFGVIHFYNSREFLELLLAQPLKRKSIFMGMYLGLSLSLSLSYLLGLGIPFILYGILVSAQVFNFITLLGTGFALTMIFSGIALWIAIRQENRLKGFGLSIMVWLFLAFVYDGLFLLSLLLFEEYPLEKASIAMSVFNPIDLSRILVMLQLDISALMGYTGAVFEKFFGTGLGMGVSVLALIVWIIVPVLFQLRAASRKDF